MNRRALHLTDQSRSDQRAALAGGGLKGLPSASQQAALLGRKVLAGLAKGRQRAIEMNQARAKARASVILTLAAADVVAGRPTRGRAGRLSRQLKRAGTGLSERHVKRLLDRLFKMSDLMAQNSFQTTKETYHAES